MTTTNLTAWVPLARHLNIPQDTPRGEQLQKLLPKFLEDFSTASSLLEPRIEFKNAEVATPKSAVHTRLLGNKNIPTLLADIIFVKVVANVDADNIEFKYDGPTDRSRLAQDIAAMLMAQAMENVLLCSELALPGLIDASSGIVVAGKNSSHAIRSKGSFFELRFGVPYGLNWPTIQDMPLTTVASWLSQTNYLSSALPTNRVERAFAAFTHIVGLTQYRDGETLFRAMQGLESFYCDGIGDLRKQLAEKSKIWLGPPPTTKNIVGLLYDTRSKFIHGSAAFEYFYKHQDAWLIDARGEQQKYHAGTMAVNLLVATLQRCIREDVHNLSWQYKMLAVA